MKPSAHHSASPRQVENEVQVDAENNVIPQRVNGILHLTSNIPKELADSSLNDTSVEYVPSLAKGDYVFPIAFGSGVAMVILAMFIFLFCSRQSSRPVARQTLVQQEQSMAASRVTEIFRSNTMVSNATTSTQDSGTPILAPMLQFDPNRRVGSGSNNARRRSRVY